MPDASRSLKVALSYLEDLHKEASRIQTIESFSTREQMAEDAIRGDLALARREIASAAQAGADTSLLREATAACFMAEAYLCRAVVVGPPAPHAQSRYRRWGERLVEAARGAASTVPTFEAYYLMGLALAALKRKREAIEAFRTAERLGDERQSIEATKEISRLEQQSRCFVATACYGNAEHPDVVTLRRFRDEVLSRNLLGRVFVNLYYLVSPSLAQILAARPILAAFVRTLVLERVARRLDRSAQPRTAGRNRR